ncbi:MAG TPA: hypothetical protein VMD30_08850 [Tepidisphaeraceae bacterium]|nr:hypothetical protein [Tepidisphaeraceae bacterium]
MSTAVAKIPIGDEATNQIGKAAATSSAATCWAPLRFRQGALQLAANAIPQGNRSSITAIGVHRGKCPATDDRIIAKFALAVKFYLESILFAGICQAQVNACTGMNGSRLSC